MSTLRVTLLGCVQITHDCWDTKISLSPEIQGLLAYLLVHRQRAHSREVLAEVFWGEYSHEKAHRALSTALWRLKKALEPDGVPSGTYLTSVHPTEIGFNRQSQYWLDVEVFEHQIEYLTDFTSQTINLRDIRELEKILNLYQGELLEGFYDEWTFRERERLRALYMKGLSFILRYYAFHKVYDKAISYGELILQLDPLREDIHREMMKLYLHNGQRPLAARQYAICQLALLKELGISPMEETQALYAQIFPEANRGPRVLSFNAAMNYEQAIRQLQQVSQVMSLVQEQVQETIYCLTSYTRPENGTISSGFGDQQRTDNRKEKHRVE